MFILRFIINFCISFIILSIHVNGRTIFNHLYQLTNSVASRNIDSITEKSKQLFTRKKQMRKNVNQQKFLSEDSLSPKVHLSTTEEDNKNIARDSYTDEEREAMRRVFENNR